MTKKNIEIEILHSDFHDGMVYISFPINEYFNTNKSKKNYGEVLLSLDDFKDALLEHEELKTIWDT